MHLVVSVNYSHLVIPMSAEAGALIALLERAKVCKENGYGNTATFTVTDEQVIIHLIDDKRVISVPSKEYSAMEDLFNMTTRAYEAEAARDKLQKELDNLKLKFAPFMESKEELDNAE